jgi:hypothetical protein
MAPVAVRFPSRLNRADAGFGSTTAQLEVFLETRNCLVGFVYGVNVPCFPVHLSIQLGCLSIQFARMSDERVVVHVALPSSVAVKLDAQADAELRSRSNLAALLIRRGLQDDVRPRDVEVE